MHSQTFFASLYGHRSSTRLGQRATVYVLAGAAGQRSPASRPVVTLSRLHVTRSRLDLPQRSPGVAALAVNQELPSAKVMDSVSQP